MAQQNIEVDFGQLLARVLTLAENIRHVVTAKARADLNQYLKDKPEGSDLLAKHPFDAADFFGSVEIGHDFLTTGQFLAQPDVRHIVDSGGTS